MRAGRAVAATCLLALVVACGGDDGGDGITAGPTTELASRATVAGAPALDGQAVTTGTTWSTVATTTGAGEPSTTSGGTSWPAIEPGGVGDLAPALLRPDVSERLVVEVHADARPADETVAHVVDLLGAASGKDVAVASAAAPGGGDRAWTAQELVAAADAGSTTGQGGGVAVVRLLFVHGTYEGDAGVLGIAVRGDVAAVFLDRVEASAGLLGDSGGIEVAVAAHELGHLLGLVDLHLATGRADPDHPGHSRNPGSVMYWAVESDLVGQLLGADPPRDFDDADRADLATIRAGG